MKPEERLAAALDAVPGSDDLEDSPTDSAQDRLAVMLDRGGPVFERAVDDGFESARKGKELERPAASHAIKEAIEDVMLGPVVDVATGRRANTGINTYIQHHGQSLPVPLIRLIAWQDTLRRALEKL